MISRRRAGAGAGACIAVGMLLLTGCTGVPDSSAPQVIKTIGAQPGPRPAVITPEPGADPRSIVAAFLENNVADDEGHAAAKKFLTADARTTWNDNTATVLDSTSQISTLSNNTITVTGREVGILDSTGAYAPSGGTGLQSVTFGMKQVGGQWRIDKLYKQGLLISAAQFSLDYQEQTVYFYDPAVQRLVPDPRYTSLTDPQLLATWLLNQYVTSPTPATLTSALPQIPNANSAHVTVGASVSIELPGANQLAGPTRDKMAAQVALTLDQAVAHDTPMTITDGNQPVNIPRAGGTRFSWAVFSDLLNSANPDPALYYVTPNGGVSTAQGSVPLTGGLGSGQYGLRSVALATSATSSALLVAGVAGSPGNQRLLIGRADRALVRVAIPAGSLTRPSWVPKLDEVWVGDGNKLYRVDAATGAAHLVPISSAASAAGVPVTRVMAVRFSPEGARLALVLRTPNASASALWIGTVNRSSPTVSVTLDQPSISPASVVITDAAWNGALKLFAVGHDSARTPGVFEVHCDGSLWTPSAIGNLPGEPDSITVAADVVAAVSVGGIGGTVWIQRGGGWASPNTALTYGAAPVYVE